MSRKRPDNDNAESITPIKQLITVTPASWKGQPVVEERWLVLNRAEGKEGEGAAFEILLPIYQ